MLLHSLAGGTGSGAGTRLAEILRDNYKSSFLVNQVAWPFSTGEVVVQNYNGILSLSHLNEVSDVIIVSDNEEQQKICQQQLKIKQPSLFDLNKVIAESLASIMLPSYHMRSDNEWDNISDLLSTTAFRDGKWKQSLSQQQSISFSLSLPRYEQGYLQSGSSTLQDFVMQMAPHPGYRLTTLKSYPLEAPNARSHTDELWKSILSGLNQQIGSAKSVAISLYLRGGQHIGDTISNQSASDNRRITIATETKRALDQIFSHD
ncbi:MAG: putative tubulin delta chain [Streblomastix strix]|uniref:Tubulin delta chain n=1 Tax=Streblomastix strix TaxID=222440 RepID=A0A5J4UWB9_9EUKA|nr:MAG: putative tubulin delta chain [Streblomastix strix]